MAFAQVKRVQERKALIDKFLNNREVLKKCIIDEKIGRQRFQKDLARPLQQHIKAELDRQQDKLISKLQECLKTLTTTREDIVDDLANLLPHIAAISKPPIPPALPAVVEVDAIASINIDKDLDSKVLEVYNLQLPSDRTRNKLTGIDLCIEITSGN